MRRTHLQSRSIADPDDLDGAWYALAATDDEAVNAQIAAEADRRRIFCVRADSGRDGSAVTPASVDYDGLTIGVLASGEHRRSAAIRTAIAAALGGAVAGGITGGLIDWGIPAAASRRYEQEVAQGGILAVVHTDAQKVDQAAQILRQYGAKEVESHPLVKGAAAQ